MDDGDDGELAVMTSHWEPLPQLLQKNLVFNLLPDPWSIIKAKTVNGRVIDARKILISASYFEFALNCKLWNIFRIARMQRTEYAG